MADYLPLYTDDDDGITVTLSGTVVGGQLVTAAGAVAGDAATTVIGVAAQDGVSGDKITVWPNKFHRLTASGTITAGEPLCAAAAGAVRAAVIGTDPDNAVIGRALTAATNGVSVSASLFGI
jgi:hypothetical protein